MKMGHTIWVAGATSYKPEFSDPDLLYNDVSSLIAVFKRRQINTYVDKEYWASMRRLIFKRWR
jgi:hypothetical protein